MKAYKLFIGLIETEPMVWRRVVVPAGITFKNLHDIIQCSFDWRDSHFYEFIFEHDPVSITNSEGRVNEYNYFLRHSRPKDIPGEFAEQILQRPALLSSKVKIDKYLTKAKIIRYIYDFGDSWLHQIELEGIIEDNDFEFPICISGENPCPPEDVGGIGGYEDFIESYRDQEHPDHEEIVKWAESIDYKDSFDIKRINEFMEHVLKTKKINK